MTTSKRRAMAPSQWQQVRKDTATSASLAESGKAPPVQISGSDIEDKKVETPPVEANKVEELAVPEKCGCRLAKDEPAEKCGCKLAAKSEELAKEPTLREAAAKMFGMKVGPDGELSDIEKGTDGVMIALVAPDHIAKKLARAGGEKPEDLHVTLGYYGKVGKDIHADHISEMEKCVAKVAAARKPFQAVIGGVGRFNASASSDAKDVLIAHVDSPDLHDVRDEIIANVQKCVSGIASLKAIGDKSGETVTPPDPAVGPMPFRNHGYTPHMTLAYIEQDAAMPIHKLDRDEFTFTHLVMAVGKARKVFALGEEQNVAKSAWCPIIKADDAERLATGIVLQPETVDAQGDIYSADVIKNAAHNFLSIYNKKSQLGLQHEVMGPGGVELVESWIAPVDMELNGRPIKKGTWMMTVRVPDDKLWNQIKLGKLRGFSIGGVAKVRRLAA